jgi:ATP synthase F1 gamma subunit
MWRIAHRQRCTPGARAWCGGSGPEMPSHAIKWVTQPPEDVDLHLAPQYIFEPDATTILAALLPRYLETQLRQALLETVACFYGAQMIAMRTATDNATELLEDLALGYSKARQTAITTQILEIVAGAGDGRANITR